jgi:peptidoglycan/LPS O-acetylase OafA/YrhL
MSQLRDKNNNFNALRFLFASLVILSHAPELQDGDRRHELLTQIFGTISFGEMAVQSFLLISGYLIVKSWQERPQVAVFLTHRILRIYPGFVVASLVCALLIAPAFGASDYWAQFRIGEYLKSLLFLKQPAIPGVFEGSHYAAVNGSMWSISYEFKCYVIALIFGLLGFLKKRNVWLALAIFCTVVHVINRSGWASLPSDLTIRLFMAFAYGGCFYLYENALPWRSSMAWAGLLLLGVLLFIPMTAQPALCLLGGYAILHFAKSGPTVLGFHRWPDISYGVYLYAWPLNKIWLWYFPQMNLAALVLLVFFSSVLVGLVSWYAVEKPCLKLKALLPRSPA